MKDSNIEWTDHTFNPWWGCTKVSAGCKNCYAETLANRYQKDCWGPKGIRKSMSEPYWKQPHKWNREAEAEGVRRRVFCASMADICEGFETMPAESRDMVTASRVRLKETILATPWLDWLLLTKRPENFDCLGFDEWPSNVWGGTSVEDQEQADKRIPELQKQAFTIRFLSCEPLLGRVDLSGYWLCDKMGATRYPFPDLPLEHRTTRLDLLDWVICGGESGPGKRPMDIAWARSLRDQCESAEVAFFMKQIDKVQPIPEDLMIRQFPALPTFGGNPQDPQEVQQ